jgi:hypothetical protein
LFYVDSDPAYVYHKCEPGIRFEIHSHFACKSGSGYS